MVTIESEARGLQGRSKKQMRFSVPKSAFRAEGWMLEPPLVRALMARLQANFPSFAEYCGGAPQYGIKTGLNEAFVIDSETRDRLVKQDPACSRVLRRFVRGSDLGRWTPRWEERWMIALASSSDHAWPWAQETKIDQAEALFRSALPSLYRHMAGLEKKLRAREDQGRFWWELRPCTYYAAFDAPKIMWQDIQFHSNYCLDTSGLYSNDTTFFVARDDPWLLACLNSPVLWWHNWRYLVHGKDEALRPKGFHMERIPIARPTTVAQADRAATLAARLKIIAEAEFAASTAISDWLRVQWGLQKAPYVLTSPFELTADSFADELRKVLPRKRKLTVAEVAAVKAEHASSVAPISQLLGEAEGLERELSAVINQAYGLTKEEEALMWQTAPPRMPVSPQNSDGVETKVAAE